MAWEAIKKIAINFAVVFIIASIFSSVAPGTAHKAYAFFEDKLGFGEPSIGYFTVAPNKDGETFSTRYSILGNYRNVLKTVVSRSYSGDVDILPSKRAEVDELSLKENVLTILNDNQGSPPLPDVKIEETRKGQALGRTGWHKFTIEVFLTNGDVVSKDMLFGLYDEEYVETLNKPVKGCGNNVFKGCNVIECKKAFMEKDLSATLETQKDITRIFNEDIAPEKCVKPEPGIFKKFENCDKNRIDELNTKFARVRLLKIINEKEGTGFEADYYKYADKLKGYKQLAVEQSLQCSHGTKGSFDGVYAFLDKNGWQRLPTGSKLKEWESKIMGNLNKRLDSATGPIISKLIAAVNDDRSLSLSWELLGSSEKMKDGSYVISHSYKRLESDKSAISVSVDTVKGSDASFKTPANQPSGRHYFKIEVFSGPGREKMLSAYETSMGFFDDAYIQLFKGGLKGCVKRGPGDKKGMDELSLKDCDVDAQKKAVLKSNPNGCGQQGDKCALVRAAYSKADIGDRNRCKHKPALARDNFEGCTPEEVDSVWSEYLKIMVATKFSDYYYCEGPLSPDPLAVCKVKRQVIVTLRDKLGWTDLREHKGWESK